MISRREFLQAAAAAGLTLVATADALPKLPESPALPTSVPSPDGGVDFNGMLGGIYITPTHVKADSWAEVWVTRPNGDMLIHGKFMQYSGWYWMAEPMTQIIGPVNVRCSVKSDITLAGKGLGSACSTLTRVRKWTN